jgi:hypothetical protein
VLGKKPDASAAALHMQAPSQRTSRLYTQVGGARIRARRLGWPQAWSRHGTGVRRSACKHARVLAHSAWRVHPVTGDGANAAGATGHGVLRIYLQKPARDKARPALTIVSLVDDEPGMTDTRDSSASRRPPVRLGWPTASLERVVACAGHSRA